MGRNDLCFCGSGNKVKKCHADVNEESMLAHLLRLYNHIDNKLEDGIDKQGINLICKKGCSECCYDYFYISQIEFFGILNFLMTNNIDYQSILTKAIRYMEVINNEYPDEYQRLNIRSQKLSLNQILDDSAIMRTSQGCIFLNPITKSCEIYQVRPIICRNYGITKQFGSCPKIESSNNLHEDKLESYSENVDCFIINNKTVVRRPYPLAEWFTFENEQQYLYRYAVERSVNEFKQILATMYKL